MANGSSFVPDQTGFSRVFIIEDGVRADREAVYHSCMRLDTLEQSYGDVERIECPDPNKANEFVEVGEVQGADERPTSSLVGRYPAKELSTLKRLADQRCPGDIHMNIGICKDVQVFNQFEKKLILEGNLITNYATDTLGALSSDERAVVNETAEVSMREWYEIVGLSFDRQADAIVTNEVLDVVICDQKSCGDCEDASDGCQKIFAITAAAGGSPGTPADVVYSLDGGATWNADDIDTLGAAENPSAVACVGEYLVVVSNDSNSLHYALLSEFDGVTDPTFTEVATGFVTGGEPNDIWSVGNKAFIVGDGGYVYTTTDPTAGVTVIDAGVAEQDDLLAVHAVNENFMVGVGNNGAIVKTENGTTVGALGGPVGIGINLQAVWIKGNSTDEWFIGASNGNYYYTTNNGTTWTTGSFSGSGTGNVYDIAFATNSIGYLSHSTTAPAGRIFRTYDGGNTWVLTPDQSTASLPANDRINALAACPDNPNFVIGVGLADDASDGIILAGEG
jgi:photosystem II stability/assembly factor-like uncharacterized protein